MRCPECNNTERFKLFQNGWFQLAVEKTSDGDYQLIETTDSEVEDTQEIICRECKFTSLPEVFSSEGPWRKVVEVAGVYTIQSREVIHFETSMLIGHIVLKSGGDVYEKLYKIHIATSIDQLPTVLVDDHPAVRNMAREKLKQLQEVALHGT